MAFPSWHDLRFKIDVSGYSGNNLGAPQHVLFIMGGAQYERSVRRERFFAHALFGDGGFNRNWGPNGALAGTASFSNMLGGGLDTPLSQHIGIRIEGDYQHTNLALIQTEADPVPYRIQGLPNSFGRFSTGLVWTPRVYTTNHIASGTTGVPERPVESELAFETRASFGHYHIFAGTWWSYLWLAGLEYDRHSWGNFIGARMDYVAEVLPVVILRQPSTTDVFGDPLAPGHEIVAGLGNYADRCAHVVERRKGLEAILYRQGRDDRFYSESALEVRLVREFHPATKYGNPVQVEPSLGCARRRQ